jgi:hypothetical protein
MNDLPSDTMTGTDMPDAYQGDGYEFSIRLPNHQRLRVHVTRAALEVLNQGQPPAYQLTMLTRRLPLLHKLAHQRHGQTGRERIVIGPADLLGVTGTPQATDNG